MAGKVCTVCVHPNRQAVDLAIGAGVPLRTVAKRNEPLKYSAVYRHSKGCKLHGPTPSEMRIATAAQQQVKRGSIALFEAEVGGAADLARLSERVARLVADKAIENAEGGTLGGEALYDTLAAIKGAVEARGGGLRVWAETMAKLTGELQAGARVQVNILEMPDTQRFLEVIGKALAPYPEAQSAVEAALLSVAKM